MSHVHQHTVLVVEDESLIRMDTAESLREAGFAVVEATDSAEALEAVEKHDDIGLMFTDIHMPGGMDGLELAHYVHANHPQIHLILTSGARTLRPEEIPHRGAFFRKPYSTDAVAQTMWRLLA